MARDAVPGFFGSDGLHLSHGIAYPRHPWRRIAVVQREQFAQSHACERARIAEFALRESAAFQRLRRSLDACDATKALQASFEPAASLSTH
jgi:hypothetical protein